MRVVANENIIEKNATSYSVPGPKLYMAVVLNHGAGTHWGPTIPMEL